MKLYVAVKEGRFCKTFIMLTDNFHSESYGDLGSNQNASTIFPTDCIRGLHLYLDEEGLVF